MSDAFVICGGEAWLSGSAQLVWLRAAFTKTSMSIRLDERRGRHICGSRRGI